MKVTLDLLRDTLARLVPIAERAASEKQDAKSRTEAADALNLSRRKLCLQVVAIGHVLGLGKATLNGHVSDVLPDKDKRRAVSLSEGRKILAKHPQSGKLATMWATGKFPEKGFGSVQNALDAVNPKPDALKNVQRAVSKAITAGKSPDAIRQSVEAEILTRTPANKEAEAETITA